MRLCTMHIDRVVVKMRPVDILLPLIQAQLRSNTSHSQLQIQIRLQHHHHHSIHETHPIPIPSQNSSYSPQSQKPYPIEDVSCWFENLDLLDHDVRSGRNRNGSGNEGLGLDWGLEGRKVVEEPKCGDPRRLLTRESEKARIISISQADRCMTQKKTRNGQNEG